MRALPLSLLLFTACPPATLEIDEPASSLDLSLSVIDTAASPADGKVGIVVQISKGGEVADLGSNAAVGCNGVPLSFGGIGYEARVPLVAAGGKYTITHTRTGVTTSVSATAPPRPVVLTPTAGSMISRASKLTLTYQAAAGTSVRAAASDGMTSVGGPDEDDSGTYTGLDVSALRAGPGTITLTRDQNVNVEGAGFRTATSTFTISSIDVAVTWK
jgi:hypothetical protein